MGFSFSWIAVQGLTREEVLDGLGMEISDVQTDLLEGVALFDWPGEWLVVLSDDPVDAFEGPLAELGPLAQAAVARSFDGHVLHNVTYGYEGGDNLWSVTVNPGRRVFRVVGQPPEQLDSIISAAKTGQEHSEVDLFFDIPAVLAESICGFRLGKGDPDDIRHVSLKSTRVVRPKAVVRATGKPGFFARLFGRG